MQMSFSDEIVHARKALEELVEKIISGKDRVT